MHSRRSAGSAAVVATPSHALRKGVRSDGGATPDASAEITLSWTTVPARLQPARAALAFAVVLLTGWVALAAFHSPLMAFVGSIAVLGSVTEAMFPIHHRLSSSGAFTRCGWQMRQMTWGAVKSARIGPDGIHLSPFKDGARLGRMRGVTLRFADGSHDEVTEAVRRFLKRDPV